MAKKPTIKKAGLKFNGKLIPINKNKITHLVQHHMAHPKWTIIDVHNYHKNTNKWAGIGYNFWIAFDGTIYEGRGFNVGAHVAGYNSTTLGIGYQGDFTKQKMTDAQVKAGRALNQWLMSELGLSKNAIVGHRDLASTACPGNNFRMSEIKSGTTKLTPSDNKKYRLKTGTFKNANDLVKAKERIAKHFNWIIYEVPESTNWNPQYRIYTGTFTGKNVAEQAAKELKKLTNWTVYVIEE